eukprot:TRINITY_DN471_c0_g1_i1.p1 TRINITY_DN471_c0_g1~~TRINITY_DN471_c0_g1_i1.p1  ORF type:complete len:134 (-),score=20.37 TRINITY_DN471_c0_g1_i1:40-405(-)
MSKKCPNCNKSVFPMEEIKADTASYHRGCFKCTHCKKTLERGKQSTRNGKLYCDRCATSLFGAAGFRGAGSAIDSHERPTDVYSGPAGPDHVVASIESGLCSSCGTKGVSGGFCSNCGNKL